MKTTIFKNLLIAMACVLGFNFLVVPHAYAADPICDNANISAEIKAANGCPGTSAPKLEITVTNILNAIIAVLGIVAVIFVIVGGVQYMTSTGDAGKVQKAKNTILYALIGLAICALSFAIVNWTIGTISGRSAPAAEETEEP